MSKIKMVDILQNVETERFKLDSFEINQNNRSFRTNIPYGVYMRLLDKQKQEVIMSDTPMEWSTNIKFIREANGDVLIAGLGMGMVLLAIQDKLDVNTITVVEKEPEIINMICSQLPLNEKVRVVQGDIFDWKPQRGTKYDTIYFDIWNYVNEDVYEEMKSLKNKFRARLNKENPNKFIKCWAENQARYGYRL